MKGQSNTNDIEAGIIMNARRGGFGNPYPMALDTNNTLLLRIWETELMGVTFGIEFGKFARTAVHGILGACASTIDGFDASSGAWRNHDERTQPTDVRLYELSNQWSDSEFENQDLHISCFADLSRIWQVPALAKNPESVAEPKNGGVQFFKGFIYAVTGPEFCKVDLEVSNTPLF